MTTVTTFHLFPHLPFELRLKVWEHALSEPRTVIISCQRERLDRERRFAKAFTSSTPPPPLLHTNHESRYESRALSLYTPSFKTDTSPNYTYISFSRDTIKCLDSVLEYMSPFEISSIQRLVLEVKDAEYFGHFHMDAIKNMENIKEVTMLAKAGEVDYIWNRAERWVESLTRDFRSAQFDNPGWVCPRVRIFHRENGEVKREIAGGSLIEGWCDGDEVPEDLFSTVFPNGFHGAMV
ncbi:hypothetical protein VE02_06535 [Pseudogymnoascus sp. 03VT05]|nr:hypothetical protein VE02_06535 [Pseudogymnoascus sp. 03VT05]